MKKTMLVLILSVLFSPLISVGAQEVTSAPIPDDHLSDPPTTALDELNKEYSSWLSLADQKTKETCTKMGRDLADVACQIEQNILYGDGVVAVSKSHPRWIDARAMAYTQAMNQAFSRYARQQSLSNSVQIVSRMLEDDDRLQAPSEGEYGDQSDLTPNRLEKLLDRVYALGEGFLDSKLAEFGVDPQKYQRAPIQVKKKLFENSVQEISRQTAYAQTAGLVPIQTFFGRVGDEEQIRVVFTNSPNRIRLVREMFQQGARMLPDPKMANSNTVAERFNLPTEALLQLYGTRLVYDEKGYPVIVAFGQAGVGVPRNSPTFSHRQQAANVAAGASALNSLTLLLNASTNYVLEQKKAAGVVTDQKMTVDANDQSFSEEMTEQLSKRFLDETINTRGKITSFQGVKTLRTWTHFDKESNQYIVGVISIWSPLTAQQTQQSKDALNASTTSPVSSTSSENQVSGSARSEETDNYVF